MKGGRRECSTETDDQQEIVNLWRTSSRILTRHYDPDYRAEWHEIQNYGSCNMWVWKRNETTKKDDKHLDCYWSPWDEKILTVKATNTVKDRGRSFKKTILTKWINLEDAYFNMDQEEFGDAMAEFIDSVYQEAFYGEAYY